MELPPNENENKEKLIVLPKIFEISLETLPLTIKEIIAFPENNVCLLYENQEYQFWSLSPAKILISQKTLPFSYLVLTKKGVSSLSFITKTLKLITIDLKTGEQEFSYDFLSNCEKDQTEFLLKINEKGTYNQIISLFQIVYLEKARALCVLVKDTLRENLMNYTLYIWQEKNPVIITHYNEKSFFITLFNIEQKMLVLFDLLHEIDKNPLMIIWETPQNNSFPNNLQERHVKLSRRLTGTIVSFALWSSTVLAGFANLIAAIENPHVFLIDIENGETKLQKFELLDEDFNGVANGSDKNWLFHKVLINNPEKNLFVFEQLKMNSGFSVVIRNNRTFYYLNDYEESLWDSSFDGECLLSCRQNKRNSGKTCVKLINFFEKKLSILFFLEKKQVLNKYGTLVVREVIDFL